MKYQIVMIILLVIWVFLLFNMSHSTKQVSDILGVSQGLIWMWDRLFTHTKTKRQKWEPNNIITLRIIKHLIFVDKYTTEGVRRQLRKGWKRTCPHCGKPVIKD